MEERKRQRYVCMLQQSGPTHNFTPHLIGALTRCSLQDELWLGLCILNGGNKLIEAMLGPAGEKAVETLSPGNKHSCTLCAHMCVYLSTA